MYRFARMLIVVCLMAVSVFALGMFQSARVVSAQQDTKALAQAWVDAQNAAIKSGNGDALWALYSPDYTSTSGLTGAAAIAEAKQDFTVIIAQFPDAVITVKDIVASADEAAIHQTVSGTNKGAIFNVPATGKIFADVDAIDILTFKDGKITKDFSLIDQASLFTDIGWSITPPATGAATPAQ